MNRAHVGFLPPKRGTMPKKKRKKAGAAIARVPRLGPPDNVRPGGVHKGIDDVTRAEALRKALADSGDERTRDSGDEG